VQWDYGKGYIDALADTGLEPDRTIAVGSCPWCQTTFEAHFRFCPRCGRSLGAVRLYHELVAQGMEEREVRALLVRAGYEPF
jgi:predicted amidophosphoribosyltransferase